MGRGTGSGALTIIGTGWREGNFFFTARHCVLGEGYAGFGQDLWLFRSLEGKRRRIPFAGRRVHVLKEGLTLSQYSATGHDLCAVEITDISVFADVGLSTARRGNYGNSSTGVVAVYGFRYNSELHVCRGTLSSDTTCQSQRGLIGHTCGSFKGCSGSPGIQNLNGRSTIVLAHTCWNGKMGSGAQNYGTTIHSILALRKKLALDGPENSLINVLYAKWTGDDILVARNESPSEKSKQALWDELEEEALQANRTKSEHRENCGDEKAEDDDEEMVARRRAAEELLGSLHGHEALLTGRVERVQLSEQFKQPKARWADMEDETQRSTPAFVESRRILELCRRKFVTQLVKKATVLDAPCADLILPIFRTFPGVAFGANEIGRALCMAKSQVVSLLSDLEEDFTLLPGPHGFVLNPDCHSASAGDDYGPFLPEYVGDFAAVVRYFKVPGLCPWSELGFADDAPVLPGPVVEAIPSPALVVAPPALSVVVPPSLIPAPEISTVPSLSAPAVAPEVSLPLSVEASAPLPTPVCESLPVPVRSAPKKTSPFFSFYNDLQNASFQLPVHSAPFDDISSFQNCSLPCLGPVVPPSVFPKAQPMSFGPTPCAAQHDPVGQSKKFWVDSFCANPDNLDESLASAPPDTFQPIRSEKFDVPSPSAEGEELRLRTCLAKWMVDSDVEALSGLSCVGSEKLFALPGSILMKEYMGCADVKFQAATLFAKTADDKVAARVVGSCSNVNFGKSSKTVSMDAAFMEVCAKHGHDFRNGSGSSFVLPPTGVTAIQDSLKGQLKNQQSVRDWSGFQALPDYAAKYTSGLEDMPNARPGIENFNFQFDAVVDGFDPSKSSGFSAKRIAGSKGAWVTGEPRELLKYLVKFRMALRMADAHLLGTMSPQEAVSRGLVDPRCVFVKNEAHNAKKLAEKRWRLIWIPSIVDSVCQGILHSKQNKLSIRSYQEGCQNRTLGGLGHHDEGLARVGAVLDWLSDGGSCQLNDEDASGWDLSVSRDAIMYDACRRNLLTSVDCSDVVSRVNRDLMLLEGLCNSLHLIAIGTQLISIDLYGITLSGILSTTEQNCNIREKQAQLCGALRAAALGDDLGYAGKLDAALARRCGVIIKCTNTCGPNGPFSLTSHLFVKKDGVWSATFENFPKLLAHIDLRRPAGKPPSADMLRGALYAIRHSDEQVLTLLAIMRDFGWAHPGAGVIDDDLLHDLY